jgi:hypothetical protein
VKKIFLIIVLLVNTACVQHVVDKPAPQTGLFPTPKQATVITNKQTDIDSFKEFILVTVGTDMTLHESSYAFNKQATDEIGFFDEVMDYDDLEIFLIQQDLSDKIPKLQGKIPLNNLAKYYKPFLWLRAETRLGEQRELYVRLILTNTVTFEDYFITETPADDIWVGVTPEKNWYPMMNSFIQYIAENSKTYKK